MSDGAEDGKHGSTDLIAPAVNLSVNLAGIEAFVIAAEHTSIAEAARAAGVEESTFLKRVVAVEAWANVALFQKRPDLILTPDGHRFLPHAKKIVIEARLFRAEESIAQVVNAIEAKVRKLKSGSLRRRHPFGEEPYIGVD